MQQKNRDIQQISSVVSDEWNESEGIPMYSAEYTNGDFGISISRTNNYEVSLHHKDSVVDQQQCNTVDKAKEIVEQYSVEPENYTE